MKLFVCRSCSHEWIDEDKNCEWCNSPSFYIGKIDDPLHISDYERIETLTGKIVRFKNILEGNIYDEQRVKYTYRKQ